MRIFGDRRLSRLASAAFSLGAILTEPKRRRAVVSDLSGRLDDAKDAVSGRYRSVAESATEILQNRSKLASHALAVTVGLAWAWDLGCFWVRAVGKKRGMRLRTKLPTSKVRSWKRHSTRRQRCPLIFQSERK